MKKMTLSLLLCAMLAFVIGGSIDLPQVSAGNAAITTEEQAIAQAKQLMLVPDGASFSKVKLYKDASDYWQMNFAIPRIYGDEKWAEGGDIRLRSSDGELLEYVYTSWPPQSIDQDLSNSEQKIDRDEAIEIAKDFVKEQPWKLDAEWMIDPNPESEYETRGDYKSMHKIRFVRTYKGIRTTAGSVAVYVSKAGGKVLAYQVRWGRTLFAEPTPKLDIAAAARIFFGKVEPILTNGGGDGLPGVLAYEMASFYWIDATNGALPESFNLQEPTWYKVVGKPRVPKALAKRLLLSMYDIELQYVGKDYSIDGSKESLAYILKLKPSAPRFYTGQGPSVNAANGEWMDFIGEPLTQPVPEASDWLIAAAASTKQITYPAAISVDGRFAAFTVAPRMRKGIALASSRELLGALKATFQWNAKTKQITAVKDGNKLVLTVGSSKAYSNGKPIKLPAPPVLVNGRTYIPAAAVAQACGGEAYWNAASRMLLLRNAPKGAALSEAELGRLRWDAQLKWELGKI